MLSSFALLLFVLVPSAVFLLVLRREIVAVLFMRGLFDARSVSLTAAPLAAYALGLPGYGAAAVLTRGFYAFKNTRTPVLVGVASIAVNAALDAALMGPLGHTGIALATSFVGALNFLLLLVSFRRMHLRVPLAGLRAPAAKALLASGLMALFLAGAARLGAAAPLPLCAAAAGAAAVYLGASHLLKPLGGTWV